jgi:putative heme iron utilization protein
MRKLSIALLLLLAVTPMFAKVKHKEKRFDPVAVNNLRAAAGEYVGIQPEQFVLTLTSSGGALRNFGRTAQLRDIRIDGAELTATAVYSDGVREPLHATFVNRVLNGDSAFGVLIRDVTIEMDGLTLTQLFCRRR